MTAGRPSGDRPSATFWRGLALGVPLGVLIWAALICLVWFSLSGCSARLVLSPRSSEAESLSAIEAEREGRLELVRNAQLLLDYQTARCVMRGGTTCAIPRFP